MAAPTSHPLIRPLTSSKLKPPFQRRSHQALREPYQVCQQTRWCSHPAAPTQPPAPNPPHTDANLGPSAGAPLAASFTSCPYRLEPSTDGVDGAQHRTAPAATFKGEGTPWCGARPCSAPGWPGWLCTRSPRPRRRVKISKQCRHGIPAGPAAAVWTTLDAPLRAPCNSSAFHQAPLRKCRVRSPCLVIDCLTDPLSRCRMPSSKVLGCQGRLHTTPPPASHASGVFNCPVSRQSSRHWQRGVRRDSVPESGWGYTARHIDTCIDADSRLSRSPVQVYPRGLAPRVLRSTAPEFSGPLRPLVWEECSPPGRWWRQLPAEQQHPQGASRPEGGEPLMSPPRPQIGAHPTRGGARRGRNASRQLWMQRNWRLVGTTLRVPHKKSLTLGEGDEEASGHVIVANSLPIWPPPCHFLPRLVRYVGGGLSVLKPVDHPTTQTRLPRMHLLRCRSQGAHQPTQVTGRRERSAWPATGKGGSAVPCHVGGSQPAARNGRTDGWSPCGSPGQSLPAALTFGLDRPRLPGPDVPARCPRAHFSASSS
ncbi:hypothetical protein ACCO45_008346 [Purpureocillium lilacinum]|uniref:Uncharacterized protein n=1 Tax=Purpureocillium lilacinum TaxID=33203 RepID=A0ACC4DP51_PURLI